jgi:ubiquinone/menaquinone biosynthesis C-methylase UbiE
MIRTLAGKVRRRVMNGLRSALGGSAPAAPPAEVPKLDQRADQWFWDHYEWAPLELLAFMAEAGETIESREVADVGCGDGIIDLGLVRHGRPARLVGFDVNPVRDDLLLERARAAEVADELPPELEFRECVAEKLPAPDDAFDVVVTWSAFEHIDDPAVVLAEIRRVLRPDGVLFLQLWPFYHSRFGAHLDEWYPEGFVQFERDADAIEADVLARAENEDWARYKLAEFRTLNRITLDELGQALVDAGFRVTMLQLLAERAHLPAEVHGLPLSHLGVAGVMLLAR